MKRLLPRWGGFASNVLTLATGTTIAQGIIIASSPILTRIYSPQDFGSLGAYISIVMMLVMVASLRYELAISLPEDEGTAVDIVLLCVSILLSISLLASICVWLISPKLVQWINAPLLINYLWMLPFSILGAGLYQTFSNWAVRKKSFGPIMQTKIIQAFGQVVVQLCLGLLAFRPSGLLVGDVVGRTSGVSILISLNWRRDKKLFAKASFGGMALAAKRYRQFPLFSTPASLLNTAGMQMPILLLSALYGPQVAGWFFLGQRLVGLPVSLVGRAVGQVFFAEASQLMRENKDPYALQRMFLKLSKKLLLASIPVGVICLTGPWIIPAIFGGDWKEAGLYLLALSPMSILQIIVSPLSMNLIVQQLQHWQLIWDVVRVLVIFSVFCGSYWAGWPAVKAVFLFSIFMTFAFFLLYIINIYSLKRHVGMES
jgi:O-antigen/teichoic acid export membrane protein